MTAPGFETCLQCRNYNHLACAGDCPCPALVHHAFEREGDGGLGRLAARIRGCTQLLVLDPDEAKRQLGQIAELLEDVNANLETVRHWLGKAATPDIDLSGSW